jgi:glycine/D-amino acid oxidase-like deaminating enzyme
MPALSSHDLSSNVVVIGGGAVGTSIAYHLAKRRIDVILVERDDIASGTSGACDGFVFLQSKKPGVHLQRALESAKMMERLSGELQRDIEYERTGGMIVVKSREDMPEMRELVERQRRLGLEVDLLDAHEARKMEPCLSPDIAGATYSPMDAQVNPISLCLAFAEAAEREGAEVLTDTEVTDISTANGKVDGVLTSRGFIKADVVVNAAGAYAPAIARMVGIDLPIEPRRGQVLVTESVPRLLKTVMICNRYITSKFNSHKAQNPQIPPDPPLRKGGTELSAPEPLQRGELDGQAFTKAEEGWSTLIKGAQVKAAQGGCSPLIKGRTKPNTPELQNPLGVGLALEQTRAGSLLIGSTREFVGYNRNVTPEGIRAILAHASDLVPIIGELNIIRSFAGLRPYTPDGMPILREVDGIEGFIVAAGHEGDGIALSPITGFLIAELVATGEMPAKYCTVHQHIGHFCAPFRCHT